MSGVPKQKSASGVSTVALLSGGLSWLSVALLAPGALAADPALPGGLDSAVTIRLAQSAPPAPSSAAAAADLPILRVILSSLKQPIAGQDIRLLLAVEPGAEPEAGMRLVVRGAPDGARFSHGKRADQVGWVIDRIDIPELEMSLPATAAGPLELHIDLNNKDGRLLVSKSIAMVVEAPDGASVAAATPPAKPASAGSEPKRPAREPAREPTREVASIVSSAPVPQVAAASPIESRPTLPATAPSSPRAPSRETETGAAAPTSAAVPAAAEPPKPSPAPAVAAAPVPAAPAPAAPNPKVSRQPLPVPKVAARQPDPPAPVQTTAAAPSAAALPGPAPTVESSSPKVPRELALAKATLATGNIASARLLLARAAEAGSAEAALLMGGTYDTAWLQANGARTVVGNRDQALRWYTQAQKLGATDAAAKIAGLPAN
jgi:hypothetical protein